jgi:serine protease
MKKKMAKFFLLAAGFAAGTWQDACLAGEQTMSRAMYRQGEVVMAGTVDQVPAGYRVRKVLPNAGLVVLQVEPGSEQKHVGALQAMGRKSGLNLKYQAFFVPNDPLYSAQWNLRMVQSPLAWDVTTGAQVRVAVLDTGLKTVGAVDGIACVDERPGSDIVNGDDDPEDGAGHGTHVAGTVAQTTANLTGVAGLAHGACVMPVKVLDDAGSGTSADLAEGVLFAVNNGASVMNMSLGWPARLPVSTDPVLDPALAAAHAAGVTIVCAAGNDGWRKNVSYPAISPYTIAVGAVDWNQTVASYSNGGTGLDLVAPGGGGSVPEDAVLQETFDASGWGYFYYTGTSMATPHVAAAAAMLYAVSPGITPEQVRTVLTGTAADLGAPGYDSDYGHGLLQVYNALTVSSECPDQDADGWTTCEGDCDDGNAAVNPAAGEVCGDNVDNNCNGTVDEGCEECVDADGDGWTTCDGDCDDGNTAVNPAAGEVCGDNVDNNCNGAVDEGCEECVDADGDGWTTCDGDCNDANSRVYPGHQDSRGRWGSDGIDNDCDGVIDG